MDRARAFRIFGQSEASTEEELDRSYWQLRAHLEQRLEECREAAHAAELRAELEDLDRALQLLTGTALPAPEAAPVPEAGERWRAGLPGFAIVAALVLAVALYRYGLPSVTFTAVPGSDAEVEAEAGSAEEAEETAEEAEAPARIAVRSNLEGAEVEVIDALTGDVAAQGMADGVPQSIPPGEYDLRVRHPDCFDVWSRELELRPGQHGEYAAENCNEQGWLVVRSNVGSDRLEIDGELVGSTGIERHPLSVGDHRVRVTKPGYQSWEGVVSLPAAKEVRLSASLAPSSGESGESQKRASRSGQAAPSAQPAVARGGPANRARAPESARMNDAWYRQSKGYLLSRFDTDGSGQLDTTAEIEGIPCNVWLSLEGTFDSKGLALPMSNFFGFDGSQWVEEALGVSQEMRSTAYARMKECGLR